METTGTSRTDRERWQRVEQLYLAAVERNTDDRAAFLTDACGSDASLRGDVESLLACAPRADDFIEGPALDIAARLAAEVPEAELAGRTVGPYVVEAWIGSGGMGDVYRARDRYLHRQVALKILPEVFAVDPERLERFTREAQVLASLNHPHIAAIHGFVPADGVHALALELVEGGTLAERIARGPMPVDECLPVARQVAEGLEAAHERGIVHRDLKPSNVAIRPDGTVKILDFGVAKVLQAETAAPEGPTPEPVSNIDVATTTAVTLGTPAYMSPEQAKRRPVDKRSDIWAFGVLLYEMLAARRPFHGEGTAETLAAVVAQEPDWGALPGTTPPAVRALIARCLERDPKRRLRDIGEARIVLENSSAPVVAGDRRTANVATARAWWRPVTVALVVITAAALIAVAVWRRTPTRPPVVSRFAIALPEGDVFSRGLGRHSIAIARDGTQLVYSGVPAGLYRRAVSQFDITRIQGTEGFSRVTEPAFSPDGESIAFYADGGLKRIAVAGGAPVTIATADAPYGLSWDEDGIVFGQGGKGILRVSPQGGTPHVVVRVDEGEEAHGPQLLPGGRHVLFTLARGTTSDRWDRARIVIQSLTSGARTTLVEGGSDARYLPTGHLVYARGGVLHAAPFDATGPTLTGAAVPVLEGVSRATASQTGAAHYGVSDTGTLVYIPGPIDASAGLGETMQLGLIDRRGTIERLPLPPDTFQMPRVSPDGAHLVFGTEDGKEAIVWVYDLVSGAPKRRLTFGSNNRFPVWSADGSHVVFQSDREGDAALFAQAADGSGTAERLTRPPAGTAHAPESWSPNGEWLLYSVETEGTHALWVLSLRDRTAMPFGAVRSTAPLAATFSPDGRWVAYGSTSGGRQSVYVEPFPATGAKYQLDAKELDTPSHPVWSPRGNELFYNPRPLGLEVVSVSTSPTFAFGISTPVPRPFQLSPPEQRRAYDVTPNGRFVARISPTSEAYGTGTRVIHVVVNWFDELRARTGAPR